MKTKSLLLLLTVGLSVPIWAVEPLQFSSLRQIGMGGAGVALSNGESNLIQNPALLADPDAKPEMVIRMRGSVGTDLLSKVSTLKSFTTASNDEIGTILDKLVGLKIAAEGGPSSVLSYTGNGFGIGLLSNISLTGKFINPVQPTLTLNGTADFFPTVGLASQFKIGDQSIALGASAKYIIRNTLYDKTNGTPYIELGNADLIAAQNDGVLVDKFKQFYMTRGFGLDVGALTTVSAMGLPIRVGGSVRNIGSTLSGTMKLEDGSSKNGNMTLPMTTVVGAAVTPDLPLLGAITLASDYTLAPSASIYKSLHLGAEKTLFNQMLSLRAGVNQGYVGIGMGVSLGSFELEYAFNTLENSAYVGQDGFSSHIVDVAFRW